jgi:hypothetical protein
MGKSYWLLGYSLFSKFIPDFPGALISLTNMGKLALVILLFLKCYIFNSFYVHRSIRLRRDNSASMLYFLCTCLASKQALVGGKAGLPRRHAGHCRRQGGFYRTIF